MLSLLYGPTVTSFSDYWKNHYFDYTDYMNLKCRNISKVMSLLFSTLSRFITAFLPKSKYLLILWLQSMSAVILEPKKIKSVTVSTFPVSVCHEMIGLDAMIFLNVEF